MFLLHLWTAILLWIFTADPVTTRRGDGGDGPTMFEYWEEPPIDNLDGSGTFSTVIPENPFDGEEILTIIAPGAEAFEIIYQDVEGLLSIGENGTLIVNRTYGTMDRELGENYVLIVVGTQSQADTCKFEVCENRRRKRAGGGGGGGGNGVTGTATMTIRLSDVNDEVPTFPKSEYFYRLSPGTGSRHKLAYMEATDADVNTVNSVIYYSVGAGNVNDDFYIGPRSGRLSVAVGHSLNSSIPVYALILVAVDTGYPALSGTTTTYITVC